MIRRNIVRAAPDVALRMTLVEVFAGDKGTVDIEVIIDEGPENNHAKRICSICGGKRYPGDDSPLALYVAQIDGEEPKFPTTLMLYPERHQHTKGYVEIDDRGAGIETPPEYADENRAKTG